MKDQGLVYSKYFIKGDLIIMVLIINTWLRLGNVHGHIDCWLETGNKQQSLSKSDVNMNLYAALWRLMTSSAPVVITFSVTNAATCFFFLFPACKSFSLFYSTLCPLLSDCYFFFSFFSVPPPVFQWEVLNSQFVIVFRPCSSLNQMGGIYLW